MARLTIDTGTAGNTATGDSIRSAFTKVNANFTEIYNELGSSGILSDLSFAGNTISTDNTNQNLILDPNGTGKVIVEGTVDLGGLTFDSQTITGLTTNSNIKLAPAGTGSIDVDTSRIINVTDPTSAQDAATKNYVDTQLSSSSHSFTFVGDDSTGTSVTQGETFKIAGAQNVTTAVSGDTLTITGPDLSSYATTSYVDAQNTAQALTFVGDDSTGTAVNSGETFKIAGTQNITTAVSGDTLTITGPDLSSYLTSETSHADVLVDGDFGSAGIMATNGSGTYSIVTDNSTNWNTAYGWGDHASAGYLTSTGTQTIDNLSFNDNIISTSSNADLNLNPGGTGQVVANSALKINKGYIEAINALTSSSTITVDFSTASVHTVTLAENTEFVVTNLPVGGTGTIIITQDGGGTNTGTFGTDGSTAVKFAGGTPTLSTAGGAIDVVTVFNDGVNYLGNIAKAYA